MGRPHPWLRVPEVTALIESQPAYYSYQTSTKHTLRKNQSQKDTIHLQKLRSHVLNYDTSMNSKCSYLRGDRAFCKTEKWALFPSSDLPSVKLLSRLQLSNLEPGTNTILTWRQGICLLQRWLWIRSWKISASWTSYQMMVFLWVRVRPSRLSGLW